jgi:hypothetical protein
MLEESYKLRNQISAESNDRPSSQFIGKYGGWRSDRVFLSGQLGNPA